MNPKCEQYKAKMEKTIDVMKSEFNTIRAGRANAAVLDKITVDYYGAPTPIQQIASISTPEPRMLAIQPWDSSALKLIEKAILASDLGINPTNDGKVIRLVFPELNEERRKALCKQVKKMVEEGKVAIRSIRRDAMDTFKKLKKDSQITEDEQKSAETELQKVTDGFIKDLDRIGAEKEKEIMSV